jgi:hypothetical protein
MSITVPMQGPNISFSEVVVELEKWLVEAQLYALA